MQLPVTDNDRRRRCNRADGVPLPTLKTRPVSRVTDAMSTSPDLVLRHNRRHVNVT